MDAWHHENEELTDLYGVPSIMDDPCVCWRYKYGRTASLSPFGVFALKFHSTYRTQHRNFGAEVPIHRNFRYNGRIGAEPAVISSPELSQGNVAELLSNPFTRRQEDAPTDKHSRLREHSSSRYL